MNKFNIWEEVHSSLEFLFGYVIGGTVGVFLGTQALLENPLPKTLSPVLFSIGFAIGGTSVAWVLLLIIFIIDRIVSKRKPKFSSNKEIEHE
jgi:ABC-type nitrate/sulfonate/bicarbonate transport system permease component